MFGSDGSENSPRGRGGGEGTKPPPEISNREIVRVRRFIPVTLHNDTTMVRVLEYDCPYFRSGVY